MFNTEAAICCRVSKIYMHAGYFKIFPSQSIKAGFSHVSRVYVKNQRSQQMPPL